MVFNGFFWRDFLLDILPPPMGELETFPHPMELPDAVFVVATVVIVTETVLILSGFYHNQKIHSNVLF